MSIFQNTESLYVNNKQELSRVFSWVGIIIFWLTFWLPRGIYLGGNSTFLGTYFLQMEVIIPIFSLGIIFVFVAQQILNYQQPLYLNSLLHGAKTTGLWLAIIFIISVFSRDFVSSVWFLPVWLLAILTIPTGYDIFSKSLNYKILITVSVLSGFLANKFLPELDISIDLLSLVSVFGLVFLSDKIPRNFRSREFWIRILAQVIYLFVIFQSDNLIFQLLALLALFFSGKMFIYRRGKLSPDVLGIIIFAGFFLTRIYLYGIYQISLPTIIPHFWTNFREILFGVGQGQFLPALQQSSEHLLSLSKLTLPNSSFLITLFEQGVLGVFAIFLLFIFSYYLRPKRSFLYIFIVLCLWIFSRDFIASGNGIILLVLFLFLDIKNKIGDIKR